MTTLSDTYSHRREAFRVALIAADKAHAERDMGEADYLALADTLKGLIQRYHVLWNTARSAELAVELDAEGDYAGYVQWRDHLLNMADRHGSMVNEVAAVVGVDLPTVTA